MIINVLSLDTNKYKMNSVFNISRLQLLISKYRMDKLYILDTVITTLIDKNYYADENSLVIAQIEKAILNMHSSSSHSQGRVEFTCYKRFKELDNKSLIYYQNKFKILNLITIDYFIMISLEFLNYVD